jgi:trans-2,3-dihydro-3-hydroxyanthranilate isomerase
MLTAPRRYHYYTADVFADRPLAGNQLAVVIDAIGLATEEMQAIAAEFNYSESTFVLPPIDGANTATVRIFTPRMEVPFAGHPNVGTAFVLATLGTCYGRPVGRSLAFEERAGLVPVELLVDGARACGATVTAPLPLTRGAPLAVDDVAAGVMLDPTDIVSARHAPLVASVGLPFIMVEVASRDALARARPNIGVLESLLPAVHAEGVHIYTRGDGDVDLRTRMFAPQDGVVEDPATGSANAALTALLADLAPEAEASLSLRIAQGVEMGRPSLLLTEARKTPGGGVRARVGGRCVMVMEGTLAL